MELRVAEHRNVMLCSITLSRFRDTDLPPRARCR